MASLKRCLKAGLGCVVIWSVPLLASPRLQPPSAPGGGTHGAAAAGSVAAAERTRPVFVEAGAALGVDFVHHAGPTGRLTIAEVMGSGVALADFDGDGDLDLFFVEGGTLDPQKPASSGASNHRLYRNDLTVLPSGERKLHFTDVTAGSGLQLGGYGMGVAAGDYDDDGRPDLYVTALGASQLWHNDGVDGAGQIHFTEMTAKAGTADGRWSVPASFLDYDRDGRLDLFVGRYLNFSLATAQPCKTAAGAPDYCGPVPSDGAADRLLHNRGDGTFEDVTAKAGLQPAQGALGEDGPGLGSVAADFNGDGWIDLYVANDEAPNLLWINQKDGTFRNDALLAGCALSGDGKTHASMGVDAGDADGDGDDDLVMDNLDGEGVTYYRNDGSGNFDDLSRASGLLVPTFPFTGFGAAWLDFDNDGKLDLLLVNGAVKVLEPQRGKEALPLRQRRQLFHNVGQGNQVKFEEVLAAEAGPSFGDLEIGRGAAFGDLDNDGDTDVVVSNNNGPARVLINQTGSQAHWLGLRLVTGKAGRDALGALAELKREGKPSLKRRARSDGSYASANDSRILFGLGSEAPKPATLTVQWPSGRRETFEGVKPDAYTTLKEGEGKAAQQ